MYDKSQDSSKQAIADAKKFCEENNIDVVEKTGTTNDEVALAADALVAAKVDAVFTPTDNTIMKAELAIYEKLQMLKYLTTQEPIHLHLTEHLPDMA